MWIYQDYRNESLNIGWDWPNFAFRYLRRANGGRCVQIQETGPNLTLALPVDSWALPGGNGTTGTNTSTIPNRFYSRTQVRILAANLPSLASSSHLSGHLVRKVGMLNGLQTFSESFPWLMIRRCPPWHDNDRAGSLVFIKRLHNADCFPGSQCLNSSCWRAKTWFHQAVLTLLCSAVLTVPALRCKQKWILSVQLWYDE